MQKGKKKENKIKKMKRLVKEKVKLSKRLILVMATSLILIVSIGFGVISNKSNENLNQNEFIEMLNQGKIKEVKIANQIVSTGLDVKYKDKEGNKGKASLLNSDEAKNEITRISKDKKVDLEIVEPSKTILSMIPQLVSILLSLGILVLFAKQMGLSFGDGGEKYMAYSDKTLKDVAGKEEEKEELMDILDYLKDPSKYEEQGIEPIRGILLEGPPGTGKTLLAQAVAGETNVPFYSIVGSEVEGMFRGDGSRFFKKVFASARKNAPAIIFIDEFDSVGGKRGTSNTDIGKDSDKTINQILKEMDGFDGRNDGVIVMATTNMAEKLDSAITRTGRFDRKVFVGNPNKEEREATLKYYLDKIKTTENLNIQRVVRMSQGFSNSDIKALVNEANLIAMKDNRVEVNDEDLDIAFNKLVAGVAKKSTVYSETQKKIISNHEVGHVIVGKAIGERTLEKVTITPHGRAGGFASFTEKEEQFVHTGETILNQIAELLGGRAGEEILSGVKTSGVSDDLQRATMLATSYVIHYGMTDSLVFFEKETSDLGSEHIDEINEVLKKQLDVAKAHVVAYRHQANLLSMVLMEREVLYKEDIDNIFDLELDNKEDVLIEYNRIMNKDKGEN